MADIEITVRSDNTDEWRRAFDAALLRALEVVGLMGERYAKGLCPVDTGRLRGSITHVVDGDRREVYIGTNVEYAPYVELNDRAFHPVGQAHFLRDAAAGHKEQYRRAIRSALS